MCKFCEQLSSLNLNNIEYITNLKNILSDEDFLDDKDYPVICYYCGSENIDTIYKQEFSEYDDNIKELIKGIMPFVKYNDCLTLWKCKDCNSILAIKDYNEGKLYYSRFDNERILEKYLMSEKYIDNDKHVKKCFHCDSKNLEDNDEQIHCNDCNQKLGYKYNNKWYLV